MFPQITLTFYATSVKSSTIINSKSMKSHKILSSTLLFSFHPCFIIHSLEPPRTSNIINRKLHFTSTIKRRSKRKKKHIETQSFVKREKSKKLKIEPINKSNAKKRIIQANYVWKLLYGHNSLYFRCRGEKKEGKSAAESRDATWQRLVDVWWLLLLLLKLI